MDENKKLLDRYAKRLQRAGVVDNRYIVAKEILPDIIDAELNGGISTYRSVSRKLRQHGVPKPFAVTRAILDEHLIQEVRAQEAVEFRRRYYSHLVFQTAYGNLSPDDQRKVDILANTMI